MCITVLLQCHLCSKQWPMAPDAAQQDPAAWHWATSLGDAVLEGDEMAPVGSAGYCETAAPPHHGQGARTAPVAFDGLPFPKQMAGLKTTLTVLTLSLQESQTRMREWVRSVQQGQKRNRVLLEAVISHQRKLCDNAGAQQTDKNAHMQGECSMASVTEHTEVPVQRETLRPEAAATLQPGSEVVAHGLLQRQDLNGSFGLILKAREPGIRGERRWAVRLAGADKAISMMSDNLLPRCQHVPGHCFAAAEHTPCGAAVTQQLLPRADLSGTWCVQAENYVADQGGAPCDGCGFEADGDSDAAATWESEQECDPSCCMFCDGAANTGVCLHCQRDRDTSYRGPG